MRATSSGTMTGADVQPSGVTPLTLLTTFWAVCTTCWSIFTPPDRTWAARAMLFQPGWAVRMYWNDGTWKQDLFLFLALHSAYSLHTGAWSLPRLEDLRWLDPRDSAMLIYYQIFSLLAVCGGFAGGIVFRGSRLGEQDQDEPLHQQRIDEQVLPPLLIASRTTHSRLFPQKHAFSYSYLLVGIPIGIQGRIDSLLSVDAQKKGWFDIDSADFLERGHAKSTLAEKLKTYLHRQGVTDRDYAFAYLVTAPRFLGYSFNPVSFWYLYDSDTNLKYMILEVNNTFDERRIYLLRAGQGEESENDIDLGTEPVNGAAKLQKQVVFSETWEKDFHVSPFNSRKGSYSLRATDPFAAYEQTGNVQIDNTIVLRSSKEHPKIVARVFSEGHPREPSQISILEAAYFIFTWCWVGFATFPRIVWEASKLFFKRKLHVWYRPEVTPTSLGRPYTDDEKELAAWFRHFITTAVSEASKALRVVYEPAHSEGVETVLYSPGFTYEEDHKRTLTLKVQSPAFYSRFVHYATAKEAFEHECLAGDERNRTATIERSELLPVLLDGIAELLENKRGPGKLSPLEQIRWAAMRRLRCPPAAQTYPEINSAGAFPPTEPELDLFVRNHFTDSHFYRRIATKLFLAERLGLGLPGVLVGLDYIFRGVLILAAMVYCTNSVIADVLRPRELRVGDIESITITLLLANAVHIWSFLKG